MDKPDHDFPIEVVQSVACRIGTPFYVYRPILARRAVEQLRIGMLEWGAGQIAYSVKTNPFGRLLCDLRRIGTMAEVVSPWELEIAYSIGFEPDKIVFNGPLKTRAAMCAVVERPPLSVNIDSIEEIQRLDSMISTLPRPVGVGVRVCPPRHGGAWSRFGLQLDSGEVDEALRRISRRPDMEVRSVHFHLGTQVKDLHRYCEAVSIAQDLWDKHSLQENVFLDIGGGFPYDHAVAPDAQPFEPYAFFRSLRRQWTGNRTPPLLIEPGRFIAAPAMAVVCAVIAAKKRDGEPTIVVLDSGTNHNVMAAFYEHQWTCLGPTGEDQPYRLCGPLCMEDDILSGTLVGPIPMVGSLMIAENAGAYSMSLGRAFIQPRPPVVLINEIGNHKVLLARESRSCSYDIWRADAPNGQ